MFEDSTGLSTPIIFPAWMGHDEVSRAFPNYKIQSAGSVLMDDGDNIVTSGKSIMLNVSSHSDDAKHIKELLRDY